eukprot:362365-Chlamydomonas_euryale.AAC.4
MFDVVQVGDVAQTCIVCKVSARCKEGACWVRCCRATRLRGDPSRCACFVRSGVAAIPHAVATAHAAVAAVTVAAALVTAVRVKYLQPPQASDLPHGFAWLQLLHVHAFAREAHLHLRHGPSSVADLCRRHSLVLSVAITSGGCGCGSDCSRGCAWEGHCTVTCGVVGAGPTALLASGVLLHASGHKIASLASAHHRGICA